MVPPCGAKSGLETRHLVLLRWPTSIRRHKSVQHFADSCSILSTSNLRVKKLPFESLGLDSPNIRDPGHVG